ncbi:MAG TPA: hypothetical protein VEK07_14400 [Polyangiaceae bacterium]|nr:hypothetical protein [Polyangiaceae bacterium]
MSESKAAPGFPYDHLAVLGFEKLQRYVPPKQAPAAQARPASEQPPKPKSTTAAVPATAEKSSK